VTDAPTWFEDDTEGARPQPRRRLVLVLALGAGAWALVALVLVRGASSDEVPPPTTDVATVPPEPGTPGGGAPPRPVPGPGPSAPWTTHHPSDGAPGGDARPSALVGRQEAEALALAVVRGWLSDGGPDLAIPGIEVDRRGYLEHAAVESVHAPSRDLVVVRVLAVLLLRDEDRYADAVLRHVAVPLAVTETGARPGGPPWWLPTTPDLSTAPPPTTPVGDPDVADAVAVAMEDAGYRVAVIADLAVSEGGALVARVTATTPSGDEVDGPVWFGRTTDGLAVLGRAARPASEPPDADGAGHASGPGG
jgi:hypothetical protein